jgi:myo-inositol-1(or 4)-monophosphatase
MIVSNFAPLAPSGKDLASFANELASAARRETLARFRGHGLVEDKGNGRYDPVTEADRAAEAAMRELIERRFPDHGIQGEELDDKPAAGPLSWSLDPIDGTRSYMCGLPNWTTLIALLEAGEPVLGVIDAPCLQETYTGAGEDAAIVVQGARSSIRTSGCTRIDEARFSTTDPFLWAPPPGSLQRILGRVRVTRFGHDGYAYARLAAGSLDLVIESGLKPYDYNAVIPVVRGAGGHVGDWRGGSDFAPGEIVAAATRELYDAAVELLAAE